MNDKELQEWANKVDSSLPMECPECNKSLDQIRYSRNKDITSINLTGAVNTVEYFLAECPYCKHPLKSDEVRSRHIR